MPTGTVMTMRMMALGVALAMALAACGNAPDAPGPTGLPEPTGQLSEAVTATAITSTPPPVTVTGSATTVVTTPTDPTLIPPPPTTEEPKPKTGDCPYLATAEVRDANGQNVGRVATVDVEPDPICIFYRPDGTVMAVTRIIQAASEAEAIAAVNQWVPVADSFEVTKPRGWSGGAMALPDGIAGYPDARSIYAVSKGTVAVVALSNQGQSIKGRQMATSVITNLGL